MDFYRYPKFAGTRQRVADIVLELQDAKPFRILEARGSYFEFDEEGKVDEHLRNSMADRMDFMGATRSKGRCSTWCRRSSAVSLTPATAGP